jgi:hypothetical protein
MFFFCAPRACAQTLANPTKKPAARSSTASAVAKKHRGNCRGSGTGAAGKTTRATLPRASRSAERDHLRRARRVAARNAKNETGARAAFALGYYDLTRDKPDLALGWMRKAAGEKLLREYVQYWQAQVLSRWDRKKRRSSSSKVFSGIFPAARSPSKP